MITQVRPKQRHNATRSNAPPRYRPLDRQQQDESKGDGSLTSLQTLHRGPGTVSSYAILPHRTGTGSGRRTGAAAPGVIYFPDSAYVAVWSNNGISKFKTQLDDESMRATGTVQGDKEHMVYAEEFRSTPHEAALKCGSSATFPPH